MKKEKNKKKKMEGSRLKRKQAIKAIQDEIIKKIPLKGVLVDDYSTVIINDCIEENGYNKDMRDALRKAVRSAVKKTLQGIQVEGGNFGISMFSEVMRTWVKQYVQEKVKEKIDSIVASENVDDADISKELDENKEIETLIKERKEMQRKDVECQAMYV